MNTLNLSFYCIILAASTTLASAPDWQAEGEQVLDGFGFCTASAGDIDNDGFDDVLVSAPFFETDRGMHGRVYLYRGGTDGLQPMAILDGNQDLQEFGRAACSAGDVNGDGYGDLLIGAPGTTGTIDGQGAALIYLGGPDGISSLPAWIAYGEVEHGCFGFSVAGIGDTNNDGYDEIVVGAPYHNRGGSEMRGMVSLYHGTATGPASLSAWSHSGTQRSRFGWAIAAGRDIDGDGTADFAVAAPGDCQGPERYSSHIHIFSGTLSETGSVRTLDVLNAGGIRQRLGENGIALADINGDGLTDLLAMPQVLKNTASREQPLWYYRGTGRRLLAPTATTVWPKTNIEHYRPVFHCMDLDNDGCDDVVVGNSFATIPARDQGALVVLRGSPKGHLQDEILIVSGAQSGGWLGETVACAGDVNGDGKPDLLSSGRIPDGDYHRGRAMLWQDPAALTGTPAALVVHPAPSAEAFENRYERVKDDRLERHMIDRPWKELLEIMPKAARQGDDGPRSNPASCCHWMLGYLEELFGDMAMANLHYKHAERLLVRQWRSASCKWHRSSDLACLVDNRADNLVSQGRIAAAGPLIRKAVRIQKRCDAEGATKGCWKNRTATYRMMGYSVYTSLANLHWNEGHYNEALDSWQDLLAAAKQDQTTTSVHGLSRAYASKLSFLGDHAGAVAVLRDALACDPDAHYAECTFSTRIQLNTTLARLSGFREELLSSAESDSTAILEHKDIHGYWTSRHSIAKLLFLATRHQQSIGELDGLIVEAAKHRYFVLEAAAYELRAHNHLALGNIEQAARDCRTSLEKFRRMGLKYREPDLYLLYAQCEQASGRTEQASNTRKTAIELSNQLGLDRLCKYFGGDKTRDIADALPPVDAASVVGIVPSLMTTETQPGKRARARFLIGNLTDREQKGHLLITTTGVKAVAELATVHLLPTEATDQTTLRIPMILPPLETTPLYLACATPERLYGSEVTLAWANGGNTAGWICTPAPEGRPSRKIIHAGYIVNNPFQCAVFYHELQPESQATQNLRAVASAPCRIELIDLTSDTFLAADENGDGDFNDPGDLIWQDADHDLYPDLPPDAIHEIEIRVYPSGAKRTLSITVGHTSGGGAWKDEVVDVLQLVP